LLRVFLAGLQIGAQTVSMQMGWAMARLIDPISEITTNLLSQFYLLLATLIYVLMNGHLILIRAVVDTFETIPLLAGRSHPAVVPTIASILTEAFALGIRVAGPALVAVFLATLALGFISRTMPQLNILAAGFPIRITLVLIMLVASLGMVGVLLQDGLLMVFREIGALFL